MSRIKARIPTGAASAIVATRGRQTEDAVSLPLEFAMAMALRELEATLRLKHDILQLCSAFDKRTERPDDQTMLCDGGSERLLPDERSQIP